MPCAQLRASSQDLHNDGFSKQGRSCGARPFLKNVQWTPDGTSIVTNSSDDVVRTFVVPHDLLDHDTTSQDIAPFSHIVSAEPVGPLDTYPFYDLQEPSTNLVLSAANEQPIRLTSTITTRIVASYPLVNPTTEAYIKSSSLIFDADATHFLAGSDSCISIFDLSRPGQEPMSSLLTGPKRANAFDNPGKSMRGRVSSLAVDRQHNVLAAGTFTRHVGLYDASGRGDCLGVFCVQGTEADTVIQGNGVTQLFWSPCGQYLYIVERKSGGAMIYDIRKSGQLLCWLEGRDAYTNQRLGVDLFQNPQTGSIEVWAGGVDGCVRMWKDPTATEGGVPPHTNMTLHVDAVNSVSMHKNGGVLASASGQRHFDELESESSLRIWTV